MADISQPHVRRAPAYRPRRRSALWSFLTRYQLVELIVIIGVIVLAWLGVTFGAAQL